MKYFYIIQRSGMITEVVFKPEYYKKTCEEWVRGGRMFVTPKGHDIVIGINAQDVTNILTEDSYESFISTTKPKLYIKGGVWYDSKENKKVSYEKWKLKEIDEIIRLSSPQTEETEERELSPEERKKLFEKYKPDFLKKKVQ